MKKINRWTVIAVPIMAMFVWGILTAEAATIHVDDDTCPGTGSGTAAEPYCKIQDAIEAAESGEDEVLVHDGTYVENIDFKGKAITVRSQNGVENTTIDGSNPSDPNKGSVVTFDQGEDSGSVLEGFTITGGTGNNNIGGSAPPGMYAGGGIIITNSSSPKIINCTVDNNSTGIGGGIACAFSSSPTITNCTISNNMTNEVGGGIMCVFSSFPTITNCTISDNMADLSGGGIVCETSSPIITNCTISGNTSAKVGGGFYCHRSSSPTLTNCIISENSADYGSGFVVRDSTTATIINTNIVNNTSQNQVINNITQQATITVDGDPSDWQGQGQGLVPALSDPQGDSTGGPDADIKYIYTAVDSTYAYVMVEFYNKPLNINATLEINFDYNPTTTLNTYPSPIFFFL